VPDSAGSVRSGSCLCGRVAFTVVGDPHDPHVCGCAHCATRSGALFQWWVAFPTEDLTWTAGEELLTWFDTYVGETARAFCARCGTHLAARDYTDPSLTGILVPALEDPTDPALVPSNLHRLPQAARWLASGAGHEDTGATGTSARNGITLHGLTR